MMESWLTPIHATHKAASSFGLHVLPLFPLQQLDMVASINIMHNLGLLLLPALLLFVVVLLLQIGRAHV